MHLFFFFLQDCCRSTDILFDRLTLTVHLSWVECNADETEDFDLNLQLHSLDFIQDKCQLRLKKSSELRS